MTHHRSNGFQKRSSITFRDMQILGYSVYAAVHFFNCGEIHALSHAGEIPLVFARKFLLELLGDVFIHFPLKRHVFSGHLRDLEAVLHFAVRNIRDAFFAALDLPSEILPDIVIRDHFRIGTFHKHRHCLRGRQLVESPREREKLRKFMLVSKKLACDLLIFAANIVI